jgi:tRNA threonylcarbamoyl adenosine modification protein YjeE
LEDTFLYGRRLAKSLKTGSCLALLGDLGSGKTTLVKSIFQALKPSSDNEIQSPTFTYLHIHETTPPIYHFDLYRLKTEKEFLSMGFEEYFHQNGICLIEWANPILSLLPPSSLILEILHKSENTRELILSSI